MTADPMHAYTLAVQHSGGRGQSRYLDAFRSAVKDTEAGRDTEAAWLRLLAFPDTPAATLAGYIEGLASLRPLTPPALHGTTSGANMHTLRGEPPCRFCQATRPREAAKMRVKVRLRHRRQAKARAGVAA